MDKFITFLKILQTIPHNDNMKEVCLKSLQIYKTQNFLWNVTKTQPANLLGIRRLIIKQKHPNTIGSEQIYLHQICGISPEKKIAKMSARFCRNLPLLKILLNATPKQRRIILQTAPDELIATLCEVALNVLYGNIPLTSQQYQKLRKGKSVIKFVADKKIGVKRKRRVTNQQRGFLLLLLSIAIPFISSLIASR